MDLGQLWDCVFVYKYYNADRSCSPVFFFGPSSSALPWLAD